MTDHGWLKSETWHRFISGDDGEFSTSLAVRQVRSGNWAWSVNRYPDLHERGESGTMKQAMDAAASVAE